MSTLDHDPACTACEHDCPRGKGLGSTFCSICDDHHEASAADEEGVESYRGTLDRVLNRGASVLLLVFTLENGDKKTVKAEGRMTCRAFEEAFGSIDGACGQLLDFKVDYLGLLVGFDPQ